MLVGAEDVLSGGGTEADVGGVEDGLAVVGGEEHGGLENRDKKIKLLTLLFFSDF